jgi:hypothetical protein
MNYSDLRKVNVNEHIEKKNGLSYLSWAWAVDQLLQLDNAATWSYGEPTKFGETLMVYCTVEAFGKKMTAQLPVMDYRNKAIPNPDAMSVNTAMQRCLAKAIALHGIGLYIYSGEDVPEEDIVKKPEAVTPNAGALDGFSKGELDILSGMADDITKFVLVGKMIDAKDIWNRLNNEEKAALWSFLDSKTRSTFKKA